MNTLPRRTAFALVVAALTLAGFACGESEGSAGGEEPISLAGTSWTVTEMPGLTLVSDAAASVIFADTDLSGSGGCNQIGGTYTAADGDITVSDLLSTQMACEPEIMEQEAAFTARMTGARTYSGDAATLTIDGDKGSIVFSAAT